MSEVQRRFRYWWKSILSDNVCRQWAGNSRKGKRDLWTGSRCCSFVLLLVSLTWYLNVNKFERYWSCLGNWWGQSCEEEGKQCSSADSWGCFFNFSPNLCWDLNWNLWICHVAHVPPHDTVFLSWKWRRCPRLSSALTTRLIKYPDHHYPLWKASDDEVALIVLKRPPVTEKKIEEIEVFALSNVRRQ